MMLAGQEKQSLAFPLHFVGADAATIVNYTDNASEEQPAKLTSFAQEMALLVADIMVRTARKMTNHIYRDGLAQILETPEFAQTDDVRNLVQVFEKRPLLEQVFDEYADNNENIYSDEPNVAANIRVVIAGEGRFSELQGVSLVIGRYGVEDHATGVLGVVGPLRMSYGRTIGAVRFVSALMSDMVQDIYGVSSVSKS